MNEARLRSLLRSALALSIASCGGSTSSDQQRDASPSPTPTTTGTPTGEPSSNPPPDASVDADSGCSNGKPVLPKNETCTRYRDLPCEVPRDAGTLGQTECEKHCPIDEADGRAFFCNVQEDPSKTPYLACHYCVIGRRPEGLEPALRAEGNPVGAFFADASHLEAASIDAFHLLRDELATLDAPPSLIARAEQAARDEVRHARVTAKLAERYGALDGDWKMRPNVKPREERSLQAIAIENAVEGCVRETFGALVGLWQAEHAGDPRIRAAMRAIADDELRHAALAWSIATWLRERLDAAGRARVDGAQRDAVASLSRELHDEPAPELVERAGLPRAAEAQRLASALQATLWGTTHGSDSPTIHPTTLAPAVSQV